MTIIRRVIQKPTLILDHEDAVDALYLSVLLLRLISIL